MEIDVVIPYRYSIVTKDQELKYALRGIQTFVWGIRNVYLIGQKPGYLNGDIKFIPYAERNWYNELTKNIYSKLMLACCTPGISDPFIYFNDDHFILQYFNALDLPYYHKGADWEGRGKYQLTLNHTREIYPGVMNFDTHAPMLIHKDLFKESVGRLDWKKDFGYAIKTAYCAYNGIRGEYYPDYKIDRKVITSEDTEDIVARKFFSVGDKAMITDEMQELLENIYPHKSKYEI